MKRQTKNSQVTKFNRNIYNKVGTLFELLMLMAIYLNMVLNIFVILLNSQQRERERRGMTCIKRY